MKQSTTFALIFFMGLLFVQLSCKTDASIKGEEYASGLYLEYMDTTVNPGDNFQMYVNGKWIEDTEIPADKPSFGIGMILHEQSQDNVKSIIEYASTSDNKDGSDEQKVGGLYASYMNMDARNALGIDPLQEEFEKIESIANYKDLAKYFAYANKAGYDAPFGTFVMSDLKSPNDHAWYTWQGGLGMPDREYYLKEDEKSKSLQTSYVEHVGKMLALANVKDAEAGATAIMALETKMAENHMRKEDTRDMMRLYNAVKVDSLSDLMPKFAWDEYMLEAGTEGKVDFVVVPQLDYSRSLDEIIHSTDLETWKTYFKWSVINHTSARLSKAFDEQNFEFYGKTMRGIEEQQPLWRRAVGVVNANIGEVVGKVYVKKHFPPEAKERMVTLVNNLLKAYEVSIKDLDWMGEETKKEALDKLAKFTPKIGYPDEWKEYPAEIKSDDLFGNLMRSELAEYDRQLDKLGKPVDKKEWGMNPQTVNAYYNPTQNEIVFPAAILQPPFFDMNADDATNYGAIGGVIGHEIGHGFDDQGSTFDGDGVLRNWWTDEDRAEFKKRTSKLVEQYSAFQVYDDLNVNGDFTLGENIGDLGGLTIALKAYQMSLNGKEAPEMDGYTGVQRVFMGWAQAWRKKSREEAMRMQIGTDPHSPAIFRVNGVVRNIPEFYEAFGISEDDGLYLPPAERVKIW
ncbi:MAG: M13 family metallopeptidase [Saprospiraceae bacterium]|nr:M13 family metallopeptidase [Saprospiraceae bacterium]